MQALQLDAQLSLVACVKIGKKHDKKAIPDDAILPGLCAHLGTKRMLLLLHHSTLRSAHPLLTTLASCTVQRVLQFAALPLAKDMHATVDSLWTLAADALHPHDASRAAPAKEGNRRPLSLGVLWLMSILSALLAGLGGVFQRYITTRERFESGSPSSVAILGCVATLNAVILLPAALLESRPCSLGAGGRPRARMVAFVVYGLLQLGRMLSTLQSATMTLAYNVEMVGMLSPFCTAVAARLVLKEEFPPLLFPTLLLTLSGTGLVVLGQGALASHGAFTSLDLARMGLQSASVLMATAIRLSHRLSEGLLSSSELMLAQFSVSALPSMLFVALRDRKSLHAILALSPGGVASFFGLAWGVYLTANYLQIMVNRTLGTIRHSAASGLRLVATCLGSAILLHELPTSGCELAGLALVALGVALFYSAQLYLAQPVARRHLITASTYSARLDELGEESTTRKLQAMPSATRWDCRAASRDPSLLLV